MRLLLGENVRLATKAAYFPKGLAYDTRSRRNREWGPRPPTCDARPAPAPGARKGQYPDRVRLTDFWARMRTQFGDVYAQSVAKDYVFDKLGDRTIERALADGVDAKVVWRAVVDTFDVPQRLR